LTVFAGAEAQMSDEAARRAAELLLRARSEPDSGNAVLSRSIDLFREARSGPGADRAAVAANLGVALRMLAERTGDAEIAAQAVAEAQAAVNARASAGRYLNLAGALHVLFLLGGDDAHLAAAIGAGRAAARASDEQRLATVFASLAGLLLDRYGRTGDEADLDEALALTEQAFARPVPEDDFWSVVAHNRALALRMDYQRSFDPEVAEQAVTVGRAVAEHLPAGSPERTSAEGNLGLTLLSRYRVSQDERDLGAAIRSLAAGAGPRGSSRHHWLANLVIALTEQYRLDPRESTFERLVAVGRQAAGDTSGPGLDRGPVLVNLGGAYLEKFERTGDPDALAMAERLHIEAIEATAGAPAHRTLAYGGLAVSWQRQAAATGDTVKLGEAIDLGRRLIGRPFANVADRADVLSNLGLALADRYAATGDAEAVAEAATHLRDAVEALPANHVARPGHLSNLAVLLQSWAEGTGNQRVTDEAIDAARAATEIAGDDPRRAGYLANLGGALWRHYVRTGDRRSLRQAVQAGREALTATPVDHPDRPMYLSNLSGMLARDGSANDDPEVMDEAVLCAQEAVDRTPPGHADRAMRLSNLGLVLRYRWERDDDRAVLDRAVRAGRDAIAATPESSYALPGRLSNLAATLLARQGRCGSDADRAEAEELFRRVARHDVAAVALRVQAAVQAGHLAAGDLRWPAATTEFTLAVQLMQRLATHYTDRGDEEHDLSRFADVPGDAAACALHAGDPRLALDLLELGTGVMLARTLELRSDVTALQERFPEMAARLDRITRAMAGDDAPAPGVAAVTLHGIRRRHLDREWRDLVAVIRRLPGYERFQLPPSEAELRLLARPGPIAVISTSMYRCDALLVTADDPVRAVPLPGLTHADVADSAQMLLTAGPADDPALLRDVLARLWDDVAAPVLAALPAAVSGPAGRPPRLWWMPVGVMSLLPLHAAGHEGGPYVDDHVVCSYTPTLGSLRHHRAQPAGGDITALVVDVPDAAAPLPAARIEAARVATLLAPWATVLPGDEAGVDPVLRALADHGWLHFSGHAEADLAQPSDSHLVLADGPLRIADLVGRRIAAEVAVLSACSINRTRPDLTNEAVHIAAAFHLAGFRHVVGTLWPVADRVSLRLAGLLYPAVLDQGRLRPEELPGALRDAVRGLRARWPGRPAAWAAYLHLGC
jgi:hypothetical protein